MHFKRRWRWVAVAVGRDRAESGAAGVWGGAGLGGVTAAGAGLEADAEPVAEAGWVLAGEVWCWSWRLTGWTAETAAHSWPGISTRHSPAPAQSSSHTALWSAPLRPLPPRALHTSNGFSPGPAGDGDVAWNTIMNLTRGGRVKTIYQIQTRTPEKGSRLKIAFLHVFILAVCSVCQC